MFKVAKEKLDGSGIEYPLQLPNDRGRKAQLFLMVFIFLILLGGTTDVLCNEGYFQAMLYLPTAIAVGIFTMGLLHFVIRTCLLSEELKHIPGRYNDWNCVFANTYGVNRWSLIVFLLSVLFSSMEECITHTSIQIAKMKNLDYGSGMAYNYFYGYLRLVLPDPENGGPPNGIVKRIEKFTNHHHLEDSSFPIKKLFILIPHNLLTPMDLKDVSTDYKGSKNYWMEAAMSLEPQELNRAGVIQRVYKNSVYKIRDPEKPGEKPVYVVAEGATPLKTLYDVINRNPKMSRVFKDHQPEIVSAFYKTLLQIIRDSDECRDLCEIIFYVDDSDQKRKVNVARIIMDRICDLERRSKHVAAENGTE